MDFRSSVRVLSSLSRRTWRSLATGRVSGTKPRNFLTIKSTFWSTMPGSHPHWALSDAWRKAVQAFCSSPHPRFSIQINLQGVLLGSRLFETRQSLAMGGRGGLVVNVASCAAFTHHMQHERWETCQEKLDSGTCSLYSSISYQISKHGVAAVTRAFGSQDATAKTGIKVKTFSTKYHFIYWESMSVCVLGFQPELSTIRLKTGARQRWKPMTC